MTPDAWFESHDVWPDEVRALRAIVLGAGLDETLKWKQPCYMDGGRNVCIVSWRKSGAVLSFLNGGLLEDPDGRLETPGQARHGRFLRFTSVEEIEGARVWIDAFLAQAIDHARQGRKLSPLPDEIDYVDELRDRMTADPEFAAAFEALTPGRRRGWNIHFGKAKQSATRVKRIDAAWPKIQAGKGMFECACGLSQRMPRCDGSHRA